ncbi:MULTISPECIES: hypothetical protein [Planococcus]|nr:MULTISPECIES: hypothetical protein [Planococcus]MCJ1908378.1 hypothetical protein [Planococcus ruber]
MDRKIHMQIKEESIMWMALTAGIAVVAGFAFSFAKTSSRAEKITEKHREELMNREIPKEKEAQRNID